MARKAISLVSGDVAVPTYYDAQRKHVKERFASDETLSKSQSPYGRCRARIHIEGSDFAYYEF